jgi:hypothetical protein
VTVNKDFFQHRKVVIATKHGKQRVIAPLLKARLGMHPFMVRGLDTDKLGTFSGEVERIDDVVDTLRKKCRLAMELSRCDLAVASEGSFGQHPAMPFEYADDELMMMVDTSNNFEIISREVSAETNFGGSYVENEAELMKFAVKAQFPSHGLIVRNHKDAFSYMLKGIVDQKRLVDAFYECKSRFGSVYLETDMRAMYNPCRMKVIARAAEKLISRVLSQCPSCAMPGFGVAEYRQGLPCEQCGLATSSILCAVYTCTHCKFKKEEIFPNGKNAEDPMYCNYCNP